MSLLKVSDSGRFIIRADGKPFFYLADTAWELFHRLDRADAEFYLRKRASQGYTVIYAVVLSELGGLKVPNAYGDLPLLNNDPTRPQEKYFEHVDWIVNKAEELGLYVGMLPTWGDKWNKKEWGLGPEIFTPKNAEIYGEWLARRYRDKPIIWILGGDRPVETPEQFEINRAMAGGIRRGDGGKHLMTFHPGGGLGSSQSFHDDDWLDFNMWQSGHLRDVADYNMISKDYNRAPVKPVLDGEPLYEDIPNNLQDPTNPNDWINDFDVRKAAYWSLFAGAFGHTYGCNDIWQFWDKTRVPVIHARTPWKEALTLPGAMQMGYMRKLLESRPMLSRIPDQSLIVSGQEEGGAHVQATRDQSGSYAMIYIPNGQEVEIDVSKLSGERLRAWWFNPRDGKAHAAGEALKASSRHWTPPAASGLVNDWILVLDDVSRGFGIVGN